MEGTVNDNEGRNKQLPEIIKDSREEGITDTVRNALMIRIQGDNTLTKEERIEKLKKELIKLINQSDAKDESTADPEVGYDEQNAGAKKKKSKKKKSKKSKKKSKKKLKKKSKKKSKRK
jgi:hypothetical protein